MKKIDFKWVKKSQKDDDNPRPKTPASYQPFEDEADSSISWGAIGNVDTTIDKK